MSDCRAGRAIASVGSSNTMLLVACSARYATGAPQARVINALMSTTRPGAKGSGSRPEDAVPAAFAAMSIDGAGVHPIESSLRVLDARLFAAVG